MTVAVIGAGVIGLSVAHELATAGHQVTVLHELAPLETTSAVAGAVWFPYAGERGPAIDRMLASTLDRFRRIASDHPEAGIDLREGTIVERGADPDRSWTRLVEATPSDPATLPSGSTGMRATLPVATMTQYLPWLQQHCLDLGVVFTQQRVDDIDAVEADALVVCTGLGARELLDDTELYPIRGQVVRVENPGFDGFWIDDGPDGLTYLIARRDCLVLGGTHDHDDSLEPDAETEQAIISRCSQVVPEVTQARILSRAVGLRPARERLRLERLDGAARPTVVAVGHGGQGMSLSWGTAERVAELLAD